ncbi:MAG: sugar phosphate isomerase/epimerase, partial [Verrucomicrobiae bacterium]|nr:sugar phosphate isomerase/epimerase [Verrucomicrobiae bacterium]
EKTGLPVHGIVNSSKPDLAGAVEFVASIGGSSVLYVAPYDRKRPLMESWNENQAVIRKGLPAAEKHQVKILVENVWAGFLISAFDAVRFIDEINHPWFGSYFDVGNNVRWGVPQHWIELLGPRIGRLDIKEWDERKHRAEGLSKGFSSPIGEGIIEWDAVRAALKGIGYQGWATAEVGSGDRTRLADIAARMNTVLSL